MPEHVEAQDPSDAREGRIVHVTPESAGWTHVGFDLWKLKPGEEAAGGETGREVCLVFIGGKGRVSAAARISACSASAIRPSRASPGRSTCRPANLAVMAENDVSSRYARRRARRPAARRA